MIINEIMGYIWANKRNEYYKTLELVQHLSEDELFEIAAQKKMPMYSYPGTTLNLLPCSVCTYRLKNNFSGCSMCDYENDDIKHKAIMTVLEKKNKTLYAKAILQNFVNARGYMPRPKAFELISSYDSFSDEEFPEELYRELFSDNTLFSKRPFCYILETRASSISIDKLNFVKKYLPKNSRVIIEFGVEICDEWIRNYWLNKSISNLQITNAIDLIHKMGYKASADVLIGIPGFTEEQSIKYFCDTVLWLDKIRIDQIIVLPLNRKHNTLQGALYTYLRDDSFLNEVGVVQQEHTGIPWLTTILCALNDVLMRNPSISKKMRLAQIYPYQNSVKNITAYNKKTCACNTVLTEALSLYQKSGDISIISDAAAFSISDKHECSKDYKQLFQKQSNLTIAHTTKLIVDRLLLHFWPESYEAKSQCFDKELELLKEYDK
ncbi:MAG: radical SAM protein [Clostridiales bacterium]|nr:radical SAM protein [Clostridiales bacterium]